MLSMVDLSSHDVQRDSDAVRKLLLAFAARTGLTSQLPQKRYLWTDAFAVTGLLELGRHTGDTGFSELAQRLVDQVHHTLGRHRSDSSRRGWLSGLSEQEGERHPTRGGLRIGKPLPERRAGEPFDERLEWERDGQYFHYLTRWMQALDRACRALGRPRFNVWGRELAQTAHRAFRLQPAGDRPRLAWKMSVDLSRPLIAASGQHDALDGFITCTELRATALLCAAEAEGPLLDYEIASLAAMLPASGWSTADPLGLGGVLSDAERVVQLVLAGHLPDAGLLRRLLETALLGLRQYVSGGEYRQGARQRLAFRELGLAQGLSTVERMSEALREQPRFFSRDASVRALLAALGPYVALGPALVTFWLEPEHQAPPSWQEHRDINEVMLASCLLPESWLAVPVPSRIH